MTKNKTFHKIATFAAGLLVSATAFASSGRSRSSASRQIDRMPRAGPSLSSATTPGRERSRRAPSYTTTMSGSESTALLRPARAALRAVSIAVSSATRRAQVSVSTPIVATVSWPNCGRAWGSQRTHSHFSAWSGSVST